MAKLLAVPEWVRPPLHAVARVEDFTLQLYGRTKSPEVLGSWATLSWLGQIDDTQTGGPFGSGSPTEVTAYLTLRIADHLAEGCSYPATSWWASRGVVPADQWSPEQWTQRAENPYERAYAHGVRVALGWLLGELELHEADCMAPIHHEDGRRVDQGDRALYAQRLRELVQPASATTLTETR